MYEGLDLDKGRSVILVRLFYFGRRLVISWTVSYLRDYPVFQIFSMNFQVLAAIILQGQINPHPTKGENIRNLFNETFLLTLVYHICIFTPWTQSADVKYSAGWSMSVITALNLVVNIAILLFQSVKAVINDCRQKKRMEEAKKQVKGR